ncbi:glycosyltransferase family 4 protein [[Eubacterium] cellulosolvens]
MIGRSIPPFDRGGIQTHIAELSKALSVKGVETHVFIVGKGSKKPGNELKRKNLYVHPIRCVPLPRLTFGEYMSYSLNCARHIKKYNLDLVHGHSMYSFGYALTKKLPYIATLHGTQYNEFKNSLLYGASPNHIITDFSSMLMERYSGKRADRVIVVSHENRRDVISQYGIPEEKIITIPNGVTVSRFQPSTCNSKTIIFVGRLHERKGIDKLLESFSKVLDVEPEAVLKIVGSGEDESRLKQLATKLKLGSKNLQFLGFVPEKDLPGIYSSSSVFVLPSYYEGFGIVLIEAMSAGLPLISVRTGGATEVIQEGKNGYLVDYDNMHEALQKLLIDKSLRVQMGAASRKKVEKEYTWEKIASDVIKVYEELI